MRQVLGAVAEFEKTTLVAKLAAARLASAWRPARRLRAQEPCRGSPETRRAAKEPRSGVFDEMHGFPHLSQSSGGQAGARSLRSPSLRRAAVAPGRGPARRVICVYVDGQAHDPVKRVPLSSQAGALLRAQETS